MNVVDFLFDDLFPLLLDLPDLVFDIFSFSFRDLIGDLLALPDWEWLDYSLLALMLGAGLFFFVIFTLVKWFLDFIT